MSPRRRCGTCACTFSRVLSHHVLSLPGFGVDEVKRWIFMRVFVDGLGDGTEDKELGFGVWDAPCTLSSSSFEGFRFGVYRRQPLKRNSFPARTTVGP